MVGKKYVSMKTINKQKISQILFLLVLTVFFSFKSNSQNKGVSLSKSDSTKIANSSLAFYNWYLNCLEADSTYNIVQPIYHWERDIPIVDVAEYLKRLPKLGVVSNNFVQSETERFKICQDSLKNIDIKKVLDCGCSVGEFYDACNFIDYFYWINTQEKYQGCEIKDIKINNKEATCQLLFFYESENMDEKYYGEQFICIVNLSKYDDKWLIDKIEKYLK